MSTLLPSDAGIGYWLYKIINTHNSHFKEQWKIEDEITKMMVKKGHGESV